MLKEAERSFDVNLSYIIELDTSFLTFTPTPPHKEFGLFSRMRGGV